VEEILPHQLMMEATIPPNLRQVFLTATNVDVVQISKVRSIYSTRTLFTDIFSAEPVEGGERRRKKRNRWGDASENKAAGLMGLPTMIKANMTNEQLEAYTLHLRIQEISEKLRIDDVVPADGDR
jgi:hypothetical protein